MLNAAARTHAGRVRPGNEDALVCRPVEGLFAVVDGMGGEASGEVAAAIAAEAVARVSNGRALAGEAILSAALRDARSRILAEGANNPLHAKMGAVATALRFEDDGRHVVFAHVGDTRLYRVDRHGVTQLTHDHVAAEAAPGKKPAVARDLGRHDLVEPWVDTGRVKVERGDLLVLCTDGLTDAVPQEELAAELMGLWEQKVASDQVATRLVGLALARGGPDNVTVVAIRVARFRRRLSIQRIRAPAAVGLFVALVGIVLGVGLWRGHRVAGLPGVVRRTMVLTEPALLVLPEGTRTIVTPGQTLTLRGITASASGWTVELGEGASLELTLAAVTVEGPLEIVLGPGARFAMRDARVSAERVTVRGGGTVSCRDSFLRTTAGALDADGVPVELHGCQRGERGDAPTAPWTPAAEPAPGTPAPDVPPEGAAPPTEPTPPPAP